MKLYFYNSFHCGDVHFARQFVKDIMNKVQHDECYYAHNNRKGALLKDIPEINEADLIITPETDPKIPITITDDTIYINTWIGQLNLMYAHKGLGLNMHYVMFKLIYDQLDIQMEEMEFYHPTIDYNYINKKGVDEFLIDKQDKLKVLLCNNEVASSQSFTYPFHIIMYSLSKSFKDVTFILTKKENIHLPNVFFAPDFTGEEIDMMEVSYLSLFCDIIVGRSTTPYGACNVFENIKNENKVFISFCDGKHFSWSPLSCKKYLWSNNYDPNFIVSRISNEINEKI